MKRISIKWFIAEPIRDGRYFILIDVYMFSPLHNPLACVSNQLRFVGHIKEYMNYH